MADTYDDDPTLRTALAGNRLVRARAQVNGQNRTGVPVNGLPAYLPSLRFGRVYAGIMNTMQGNPNMTLGDVAQMWTQGDTAQQREGFVRGLENSMGVGRDVRVSDLSARQRQQLADAQRLHVRQTIA